MLFYLAGPYKLLTLSLQKATMAWYAFSLAILITYDRLINSNFVYFSPTKASIAASLIFVLDKKTDLVSAPHALVYFGICIFFVYFKVFYTALFLSILFVPYL